jgi:hypothetical protein
MTIVSTDACTYSVRQYPQPWPVVLDGFWKPPFLPLFWVYAAVSLYRAYTTARQRQFKLHRRWVIRLNAVFLGVTLSRPILGFLAVIWVGSPSASEEPLGLLTAAWRISGTIPNRTISTFAGKSSGALFGRVWSAISSWPKCGSQLNHTSAWELWQFVHRPRLALWRRSEPHLVPERGPFYLPSLLGSTHPMVPSQFQSLSVLYHKLI